MANKVRFLRGTSAGFAAISQKNENTFYYLTDTKELYLGENPIGGAAALQVIGSLEGLKTEEKDNLVGAINEIYDKISSGTNSKVTIEKDESGLSYTIRQGDPVTDDPDSNVIGVIDIPADVILKDSNVVENPEGMPEGKYIELITKVEGEGGTPTEKTVYLNLNDLVNPYSALENATKVQLFINEENVISATIVAGSVSTTELADGAITKAKLAQEVLDDMGTFVWGTF